MINVLICGYNGKMGSNLREIIADEADMNVVCGVDVNAATDDDNGGNGGEKSAKTPIYPSFNGVKESVDVVIDFSSPAALKGELEWAERLGVPVVLATTGYSADDLELIKTCSKKIAVFKTANFSLGVNLLVKLVKEAAAALGENFDVEIIEKHHRLKADAPSGTALMLADGVESALGSREIMNGREGRVGKRGNEIGVHAVRGGTIVGEHEVMFAGNDEIITLSHSARSKKVFAAGAVKAARWIVGKPAGLYDMTDVLGI